MAGEGWQMGFESIDQPGWSSEVECNPKMSISFFWLEKGGGLGLSPSTSPADHQKLKVMQKWAFHFMPGERWQMGFESIDEPSQWSEIESNPKISISFFWLETGGRWGSSPLTSPTDYQKFNIIQKWAFHFLAGEGWWMRFESIDQPRQSSEVERNTKISISFFWLEGWWMGFESIDQPGWWSEL